MSRLRLPSPSRQLKVNTDWTPFGTDFAVGIATLLFMNCSACQVVLVPSAVVYSPQGEQVCQSCSLSMADGYRGSDTSLRLWGLATIVAAGVGYLIGANLIPLPFSGVACSVLGATTVMGIRRARARKQAGL